VIIGAAHHADRDLRRSRRRHRRCHCRRVGSLLQTLGQRIQVVCVTHLPQVAARGAQHLRASKSSNRESTSAALTPLAADERVEELARMLGGKTVTKKTQEHAREMLESAAL
jgi:DNA repair protein RecN (Recombination protein N)